MRITLHVDQDRRVRRVDVECSETTALRGAQLVVAAIEGAVAYTYGIASRAATRAEVLHEAAQHLRDTRWYAWNGDTRRPTGWRTAADEIDRLAGRP